MRQPLPGGDLSDVPERRPANRHLRLDCRPDRPARDFRQHRQRQHARLCAQDRRSAAAGGQRHGPGRHRQWRSPGHRPVPAAGQHDRGVRRREVGRLFEVSRQRPGAVRRPFGQGLLLQWSRRHRRRLRQRGERSIVQPAARPGSVHRKRLPAGRRPHQFPDRPARPDGRHPGLRQCRQGQQPAGADRPAEHRHRPRPGERRRQRRLGEHPEPDAQ